MFAGDLKKNVAEKARSWSSWTATWVNAALATDMAVEADRWMRTAFKASATVYDKAMDAEYIRTHLGGGLHRLFDGGHDLVGAWKAVADALPDDTRLQEATAYFKAIWADMVTPAGLPVFTWDQSTYLAVRDAFVTHLGVSKHWVNDMATFTATELGGGIAAIAALLLNLRREDARRYAQLCGSLGLSAALSANPIVAAVAVVALLKAGADARQSGKWIPAGISLARGTAVSGTAIGVATFVTGGLGIALAVPAAYGVNWATEKLEARIRRIFAIQSVDAMLLEWSKLRMLEGPDALLLLPAPQGTS